MSAMKSIIVFFMLFVLSLCDDPPTDEPTTVPPEPKDQLLEDVNNKRREYATKFGISNMHQLTWNESLVETIKTLTWGSPPALPRGADDSANLAFESPWDGLETRWRMVELKTFSSTVPAIDAAVHQHLILNQPPKYEYHGGKELTISALDLIHPLQTSIGCMKVEKKDFQGRLIAPTMCLIGNIGSEWKFDVNSTKIPGSECMDGYVNDDGLCALAPTTTPDPTTTNIEPATTVEATTSSESAEITTNNPEKHRTTTGPTTVISTAPKTTPKEAVPTIPKKPDASDDKEKEGASVDKDAELEQGQEALESSVTTRNYAFGIWILTFTCLLF